MDIFYKNRIHVIPNQVVNVVNEIEQENQQSFDFIFLEGCRRHYSDNDDPCWKSEQQRLWLNKNQPRQLTNLTDTGYAFLSVKSELAETLVQFWTLQKNEAKEERWPRGISHVNHWDSPTRYLELTSSVERKIYQTLLPVVENWVGTRLIPTALYGIRVYQKGAMIAPHVERLPLVISCIMPLTFHETWPLELIIHDGTAIHLNVEKPGDIICCK
jgi:prolyl 4-hydroxylase